MSSYDHGYPIRPIYGQRRLKHVTLLHVGKRDIAWVLAFTCGNRAMTIMYVRPSPSAFAYVYKCIIRCNQIYYRGAHVK